MLFSRCSRLATSSTNRALTSYLTRASRPFSSTSPASYEHILTEVPKPGVGLSKSIFIGGQWASNCQLTNEKSP